jgi:O-antigen biosynthesis protein
LWAPNAGKRNLIAFDPDLVDVADRDDILFLPQPDLGQSVGAIVSLRNYTKTNGYIVLAEINDGKIIAAQKIEIAPKAPTQALFENIVKNAGHGRLPTPAIMERYIRPMISGMNRTIAHDAHIILDVDTKPDISVIAAVTGGLHCIHSFIATQMAAPSSLEWILVCDDPSLHEEALVYLVARKDALKCRTIFVCNKESYGTGRSNNIGARTARGRMLLFMASDVWIDDFALITKAAAAIDAGSSDVVGFRLTYEDGSLLHNGLHFKKSTQIHGLLVIDHPGKGFPPPEDSDNIIVVPAVPGALLLISKNIFESVAGFDDAYLVCDYEDIDLCMKVRASGKQIGLIQQGGCYQVSSDLSVTLGDLSLAGIVLYLNCLTFNRKWAVEIGQEIADCRWAW